MFVASFRTVVENVQRLVILPGATYCAKNVSDSFHEEQGGKMFQTKWWDVTEKAHPLSRTRH